MIEKARARASKPLEAEDLREAARRAGVPEPWDPADRAARELIAELGMGRSLDPALRHLLSDLLRRIGDDEQRDAPASDAARAVAEWMASNPRDRGRALYDLLLLADALPHAGRRGKPLEFPRLDSTRYG